MCKNLSSSFKLERAYVQNSSRRSILQLFLICCSLTNFVHSRPGDPAGSPGKVHQDWNIETEGSRIYLDDDENFVLQQTSNNSVPAVFNYLNIYKGSWTNEVTGFRQINMFQKQQGGMRCQFRMDNMTNTRPNSPTFAIEFTDGVYLDQLKFNLNFNFSKVNFSTITNSTLNYTTLVNPTTSESAVTLQKVKYFGELGTSRNISANIVLSFVNKTSLEAFDLQSTDLNSLLLRIQVTSNDSDSPISVSTLDGLLDRTEILMPSLFVLLTVFGSVATFTSVYYMIKFEPLHFMMTASYISPVILSIVYFELFAVYIILGMQYTQKYFQFLTFGGIFCFLGCMTSNRISMTFFVLQNNQDPNIDIPGMRNPRTRFYLTCTIFQLIMYITAMSLSRYPGSAYYMFVGYMYPVFHIVGCINKRTKNTFLWYYQPMLWIPTSIHAIFIRGSENNFMNLTPTPVFQYLGPAMMLLFSKLGPMFFIPKKLRPGYYNYKVLVSSLDPEKQNDDCPICFMRINETLDPPEGEQAQGQTTPTAEQSMDNQQPLLPTARKTELYCLKTPCNHYFHEECLVKWFETKPECPTCRKSLPILETTQQ